MALSAVATKTLTGGGIRNAAKITSSKNAVAASSGTNVTRPLRPANNNRILEKNNPTGESLARPPIRSVEHVTTPKSKTTSGRQRIRVLSGGLSRLAQLRNLTAANDNTKKASVKAKAIGWATAFVTVFREFGLLASLWPAQALFAVLSLIGLGAEVAAESFLGGFFSFAVPGATIWAVGLIVVMVIGFGSMIVMAVLLMILHKASFSAGHRGIYFILFSACYLIPLVNIVPWAHVWGAYVLQDKR